MTSAISKEAARTSRNRPFTVLVEGNIGCGKTTFLQHFSKFSNVNVLKEPVERWRNVNGHNLLQLMYEDPARWSMPFQSFVQLTMLDQHLDSTDRPIKLMERSIFSARYCFVENLFKSGKMQASEYEVLVQWFNFLTASPELDLKIDLIIYLRTEPEKALERVKARARGEENAIPLSYLQEVHDHHEDWLLHNKFDLPAPVLVIDANKDMDAMIQEYIKHEDHVFGRVTSSGTAEDSHDEVTALKQGLVVAGPEPIIGSLSATNVEVSAPAAL